MRRIQATRVLHFFTLACEPAQSFLVWHRRLDVLQRSVHHWEVNFVVIRRLMQPGGFAMVRCVSFGA